MKKLKIIHIINSFEYGGAEAMLCNLVSRTDRDRFEPSVVSLIDDLTVAGPVSAAGVPLATMGMRPGVPDPRGFARLARHLRRERPVVVQTWMDHSNLIGGLAGRLATSAKVVWGLHHSGHSAGLSKRSTLRTVSACAMLSGRLPAKVVCCSEQTKISYIALGFTPARLTVIPNGFDTKLFRPNSAVRAEVRREWGVEPEATVIGLIARYDPIKDHSNFLHAAARLAGQAPGVQFVLCGDKVDARNESLTALIAGLGLADRCRLLGPRRDVTRVYASLDIATSSSVSEAFPLAVGEAMACGVPCVVTDVGDSSRIVGMTGAVVPPRDPAALADALRTLISLGPEEIRRLGHSARRRVQEKFDLGSTVKSYEEIYINLASGGAIREGGGRGNWLEDLTEFSILMFAGTASVAPWRAM